MNKCDYEDCNEEGVSACIIIDIAGNDYQRVFCKHHLKKMLYDEHNVTLDE